MSQGSTTAVALPAESHAPEYHPDDLVQLAGLLRLGSVHEALEFDAAGAVDLIRDKRLAMLGGCLCWAVMFSPWDRDQKAALIRQMAIHYDREEPPTAEEHRRAEELVEAVVDIADELDAADMVGAIVG